MGTEISVEYFFDHRCAIGIALDVRSGEYRDIEVRWVMNEYRVYIVGDEGISLAVCPLPPTAMPTPLIGQSV